MANQLKYLIYWLNTFVILSGKEMQTIFDGEFASGRMLSRRMSLQRI